MVTVVAFNVGEDSHALEFFDTVPMLAGTGTRLDRVLPLSAGNGTMEETARLDVSIAGILTLLPQQAGTSGSMSVKNASVLAPKARGVTDAVIVIKADNHMATPTTHKTVEML